MNVHHHSGNTVYPFLLTPNGRIVFLGPKVIEGFKYIKIEKRKRNKDIVHSK